MFDPFTEHVSLEWHCLSTYAREHPVGASFPGLMGHISRYLGRNIYRIYTEISLQCVTVDQTELVTG